MLRIKADGREFVADRTETVTIGRTPDALIQISDNLVSRYHAEIRRDADGWVIEDLRSRNGTYADGRRITRLVIASPTVVRLGNRQSGPTIELFPDDDDIAHSGIDGDGQARPFPPDGESRIDLLAQALGERSFVYRPEQSTVRIGRAPDNDIVVDDLQVSRWHAELRRELDGTFTLVDLKSHNGTFVNGRRVTQVAITPADYVTVGNRLFRLSGDRLEEYTDTGEVTFEAVGLTALASSGQVLLDDVSFALGKCSLLAIVGPSGAGKSTLLNALTGFGPAQEGSVFYAARDLYASYEELRQRIGYVPQEDIVHGQLSVRRALEFAAELRFPSDLSAEDRSKRVDEVIGELGLTERADLPIQRLSGGQRKRSSIALELLSRPSLLFLDEPTSGLDPGYEKAIMRLLRDLADGGRTVVVVTHSLQSLDLCDRVLFLAPGGKDAFFGPPDEALDYFEEHDYADVFARLDQQRQVDWKGQFRLHDAYDHYIRQPLADRQVQRSQSIPNPLPPEAQHGWWHQFATLTRRYATIILSDRRNLALLLAQAPVLGLLIFALAPPGSFDQRGGTLHPDAQMVALMIVLAITLMGSANAIREIVKELPIYRRERSVGLSISAYVASKVAVLSALTIVQAVVLVLVAVQRQGGPQRAAVLGWPLGELWVDVALAGLASMALALLISALVTASDRAMTLLPLLLIPQIVLSGPIIPLEHKPVMQQLGYLMSANWGFSAVSATVDMPALSSPPMVPGQPVNSAVASDRRWRQSGAIWLLDVMALLALTLISVTATGLFLRRRDPAVMKTDPLAVRVGEKTWRRRAKPRLVG